MPIVNTKVGAGTKIWHKNLVNIYGCEIGRHCNIASFVEIGPGVVIGDKCRIQGFCFIPAGVTIHNGVFIGPGVVFLNVKHPPSTGREWPAINTVVESQVVIGGGALIMPGVKLGTHCVVGAGAVVTRDVVAGEVVKGIPARLHGNRKDIYGS